MWYFWRGWQQCTTMDKTWSRKQPTRRQPRHPPLCPGRSCRCGLAHLQVCWDPPVMGTSLPQTRVRKVGGISVFEGLYQHHTLQTVVLIASYSISDGVCFVLCWKYILSWRTHIMYNLPDVYEQQMSPSYHWRSHNWEKSILSHFSKLQKLYAKNIHCKKPSRCYNGHRCAHKASPRLLTKLSAVFWPFNVALNTVLNWSQQYNSNCNHRVSTRPVC